MPSVELDVGVPVLLFGSVLPDVDCSVAGGFYYVDVGSLVFVDVEVVSALFY